MKYFETEFIISPFSSDAVDLLAAMAGEIGFESFQETGDGLLGYIQQDCYNEYDLLQIVADFPMTDVSISFKVHPAEYQDWNQQWEEEGFSPIIITSPKAPAPNGYRTIIINDGRHLPPADVLQTPDTLSLEIDARMAFGTGNHETTRMICATLLAMPLGKAAVLDCGTGTGILSICALQLGAANAVGYDIDEWAADNARHNAVINHVDDRFTPLLGDATILNKVEGEFDVVLANINRNILLNDMPLFYSKMKQGATLILSGFYTADIPLLTDKAASLGLTHRSTVSDQEWACLVFGRD